jgi:imidazolonepropionase-like amidohydrolase
VGICPEKILRNGRMLDVVHGKILEKRSIWIMGASIKKIGSAEECEAFERKLPREAVFDLKGYLVMPGLIDTHVHLCIVRADSELETLVENLRAPETLKVLYGVKHAKATLESGITTVRDMGQGDNLALRGAIEKGVVSGPRIVACGWLGMTSGHGEQMASECRFNTPLRQADIGVDGPWEVRRKVRELVGQGVDFIKTYATGGGYIQHPFYSYWMERPNYTPEELRAVVDEAHSAGRRVAAQGFTNPAGTKNAITAGIDTLEHGLVLDDDDVQEMKAKEIFYVPTLAVTRAMWGGDEEGGMKYLQLEKGEAKRLLEEQLVSLERARRAGVKIAMGSDCFRVLKHGENAQELEWRVKAGIPIMEALISATKTSAEALGIEQMVGSLAEGKFADLLVVDPDPTKDISVLRHKKNLKMIMKNGEVICSQL